MSANNASLYESAKEELDKPSDFSGLGAKAQKIRDSAGPIQPPIGQTTAGAVKDVADTVGVDVGDLAVGAAGLYGLKKLWDKFGPKDGGTTSAPQPTAPTAPPAPPAAGVPPAAPQLSPIEQQKLRILELKAEREQLNLDAQKEKIARAKADAEAKQAQAAVKAKQAGGGSITESEAKMLAASETAKISKAVEADQKAQQAAAAVKQTQAGIAPAATVDAASKTPVAPTAEGAAQKTAVAQFTRDANGKIQWPQGMTPAAQAGAEGFMTQFPELAKQLEAEGRFGILGAGKGDNNLYNSYGKDFAKTLRNEVNQGQMVGKYSNYENVVNPAINAIPPESPVGKQLAEVRAANPQGGTHGPLGQGAAVKEGKLITSKNLLNPALKGGAAAALLMSIADAANAKEAARNVGEALLPWGMTPTEVESGKLTAKQFKAFEEAKKLGSPYRSVPPPR